MQFSRRFFSAQNKNWLCEDRFLLSFSRLTVLWAGTIIALCAVFPPSNILAGTTTLASSTEVFFKGSWKPGPDMPKGSYFGAAALVNPGEAIYVGGLDVDMSDSGGFSSQTYIYTWDGNTDNLK